MKAPIDCLFCDGGVMSEETYAQTTKSGRINLRVEGLRQFKCDTCESILVDDEQTSSNQAKIRSREDEVMSYVTPSILREFREKYSLSQKDASKLIGAGAAAFGKYETGQRLAGPTARLVRILLDFPAAVKKLATAERLEVRLPLETHLGLPSSATWGTTRIDIRDMEEIWDFQKLARSDFPVNDPMWIDEGNLASDRWVNQSIASCA